MSRSTSLLVVSVLALGVPISATSQTWSDQEQELIDFTQECWDGWQDEEIDPYLDRCWEEDITFWWSENSMPFGADWVARSAHTWFAEHDMAVFSLQFHKVTIHDDTAVLNYQMLGMDRGPNGELEQWSSGRSDMLHRHNGQWMVIAVHQHPGPANPGG